MNGHSWEKSTTGKDSCRQYLATTYNKPPEFEVRELIRENDFVTAPGKITLEDENAKPGHYSYCHVWRFRDGKMAELIAFVIETGERENIMNIPKWPAKLYPKAEDRNLQYSRNRKKWEVD